MQWVRYRTSAEAVSYRYLATSPLTMWATKFVIVLALILSFSSVLFAEEAKVKDYWDIADILAKIFLGIAGVAIPAVLGLGIYLYNKTQGEIVNLRQSHDLALRQISTVHQFLPELTSKDQNLQWASISLISEMGDEELARKVGTWYVTRLVKQQDRQAIQSLMDDPDPFIADLATQAFKRYNSSQVSAEPVAKMDVSAEPMAKMDEIGHGYMIKTTGAISHEAGISFKDDGTEKYGRFVVTRGAHTLHLPTEFSMGIYPVTNEFFLRFVQDRGYTTESFWKGVPRQTRDKFLCQDGRTHGPSTWPSDNEFLPGRGRHPAVGISYYEALAFCQWLQKQYQPQQSGWRWCLPTEDMWEYAARTEEGRTYPWGKEFKEGYCNSAESNIGTTTDVNRYPKGTSRDGCYDMAGNVWEFVKAEDATDWSCVLRGGSSQNNQFEIRSYLRLFRVPRDHRPPDFGFRCAQAAP